MPFSSLVVLTHTYCEDVIFVSDFSFDRIRFISVISYASTDSVLTPVRLMIKVT